METWILICTAIAILLWFLNTLRRKPSQKKGCTDAIIPVYDGGSRLAQSPDNLLRSPYFCRVTRVDDGSTDDTGAVTAEVKRKWGDRFVVVTQKNIGKGGALMNSPNHATCDQVFLNDADTYVPPDQDGMDYVLVGIERGADAVGGIPSTALGGAGLLPHTCATVKLPVIVTKHTLQQFPGGASFIVSDACGVFRTDILRRFDFLDRIKVGDPDLTWTLMADGCRIRQTNRCVVYPQECSSSREKWCRQRRWIVGCTVYMRLRKRFLLSRLSIFSIFPMLLVVPYGVGIYLITWSNEFITIGPHGVVLAIFPPIWVGVVYVIDTFSVWFHRYWLLVSLVPLSVVYALLAYAI